MLLSSHVDDLFGDLPILRLPEHISTMATPATSTKTSPKSSPKMFMTLPFTLYASDLRVDTGHALSRSLQPLKIQCRPQIHQHPSLSLRSRKPVACFGRNQGMAFTVI